MSRDDDLADVDAVLGGDLDRFEGIVARWERPLVNLAWRYTRDHAIAEEMAQEAFIQCFRKLSQWRRDADFSTWLFALAINVYRSILRKRRPPIDPANLAFLTAGGSSETGFFDEERDAMVRRAVTWLPEIYRDAIVIYHFEEEDLAVASRRLRIPEGTLKARLHRGRKLLKERLERILR